MQSKEQIENFVLAVVRERLGRPDLIGSIPSLDEPRLRAIKADIGFHQTKIKRAQSDYDNELIEGHDLSRVSTAALAMTKYSYGHSRASDFSFIPVGRRRGYILGEQARQRGTLRITQGGRGCTLAWLEAERMLGATIGRQVMEVAKPGESVERRLETLDPLMSWANALSSNLRHLRSTGHDADALAKLQTNAEEQVVAIHASHGWDLPSRSNPRIQPLE